MGMSNEDTRWPWPWSKINADRLPIVEGKCFPEYDYEKQEWFYPEPDPEPDVDDDPEDNQGNNGPLKEIRPEDVMDGLRRLAGSGILGEHWREILADAMTLLWLRYER